MKRLSQGKIPIEILRSTFLRLTGSPSSAIDTPPLAGLDFAALKVDGRHMIVSADPVTGVVKNIGRYAIRVSANDVATSGNRPQYAESVVLLPDGAGVVLAKKIAVQLHEEAKKLGISIVGGHTEVTPGLDRPIVAVTTFSFVDSYVSSRDAREGDTILMTKTAGLEGTVVLGGSGESIDAISIVEEAVASFGTGQVHAMHDCTEGGVLGAVFEMSLASGLGFELEAGWVPVTRRTAAICRKFDINPLKLIGSGALLIAVANGDEETVIDRLAPICRATAIGRFTKKGRYLIDKKGRKVVVRAAPEDELWGALAWSRRRHNRPWG
jgi:hydrogenase expression/formation protein HypE